MHKRKKGEHGIFHLSDKRRLSRRKPISIYSAPIYDMTAMLKAAIFLIAILVTAFLSFFFFSGYSYAFGKNTGSDNIKNLIAGFVYENYHDYGSSLKYLKNNLKSAGSATAYYYLSNIYFKDKKFNKAMRCLNNAIKISSAKNKNSTKYLILKAKIYTEENKIDGSIKILQSILKKNPYNEQALLFIANLYRYKRNFNSAIAFLKLVKIYYPDNINSYYELSKIYIKLNKPQKAEKNYKELLKINPYFRNGYFELAALYELTGKEKSAIKILKKYLHYAPYSKSTLYQLGLLNYALKKYIVSRKYLFNLYRITIAKETLLRNEALFYIGLSYYFQHNYTKSIMYLSKLKYGKYYVNARLEEVEIYLMLDNKNKTGKYEPNIKYIIQKLTNNKKLQKNLKVYYFSAIVLSELKQFNKAKGLIKKGLKYFPDNTALLYELGSNYHFLKNDKKSIEIMEKILKIDPLNANALNFVGYSFALKGKDLKKAKEFIKKALSIDRNSPYIMDSMGFVYFQYKQYKKALPYFIFASKRLKNSSVVLKHIGMDYFMLKNYKKALKYLKISEKIKKSKQAKRYIKKIKKDNKI